MPTPDEILLEMDQILDELIKTAERLRDLSIQVFEEEELVKLQQTQEKMVTKLLSLDEAFQTAYKEHPVKKESPIRAQIDKKIDEFQRLNAAFIENVKESHGILQFEKKKKKNP